MNEQIVINTGPLIALGKAGALEVVERLPIAFYTPRQVLTEIIAGSSLGHPVNIPPWIMVEVMSGPPSPFLLSNLDSGEAAVIQLAIERSIATVCIDELKGRRAASSFGLKTVGSLGLIGRAKTLGLISEARPFVEQAMTSGTYYDSRLVEEFLRGLGESKD